MAAKTDFFLLVIVGSLIKIKVSVIKYPDIDPSKIKKLSLPSLSLFFSFSRVLNNMDLQNAKILKIAKPTPHLQNILDQISDPTKYFLFFHHHEAFIAHLPIEILCTIFDRVGDFLSTFCLVRSVCKSWQKHASKWAQQNGKSPIIFSKKLAINFFVRNPRSHQVKSLEQVNPSLVKVQNTLDDSLKLFQIATRNLPHNDCDVASSYRKTIASFSVASERVPIPFEEPANIFENALNQIAISKNQSFESQQSIFQSSVGHYIGFLKTLKLDSFFVPAADIDVSDIKHYRPSASEWNLYLSGILSLNLTKIHLQNCNHVVWDFFELLATGNHPQLTTVIVEQVSDIYCPSNLVRNPEKVIVSCVQNLVIQLHKISDTEITTFIRSNLLGITFPNLVSLELTMNREMLLWRGFRFAFNTYEFDDFLGESKLSTLLLMDPAFPRSETLEEIPAFEESLSMPCGEFSFFARNLCAQDLHYIDDFSKFFGVILRAHSLKLYQNIIQVGKCDICDIICVTESSSEIVSDEDDSSCFCLPKDIDDKLEDHNSEHCSNGHLKRKIDSIDDSDEE